MMRTFFADILLPLAINKTYTYRIPAAMEESVAVGKRVTVQFGKNKIYSGIIKEIHEKAPTLYEAKYILSVIDEEAIIPPPSFQLWKWMSSYYICSEGEVMNAALPLALKLASETKICLNLENTDTKEVLNDKEFLVIDALEIQNELSLQDISKILGHKNIFPLIRSLINKNFILIREEIEDHYKPKSALFYKLNPVFKESEQLKKLFEDLERAPRQADMLQAYLQLSRTEQEVEKKKLLAQAGSSAAALNALVEKNILLSVRKMVSRFASEEADLPEDFSLSTAQSAALLSIKKELESKEVCLLHGITSSGKTLLYIRLMEECLKAGKQVLYLVPEIGLTVQLVNRLRKFFGNTLGVYHSKFSDNERVEVWNKTLNGSFSIILGARSSVFLPFSDLGLIIVDEEHESSFKQFDPAPRYQARDVAIYMASLYKAQVLLGSATPSMESYSNCLQGKYGLVKLEERFGGVQPPEIKVVDLKEEIKRKTMDTHFSSHLIQAIKETIAKKEQVILFQNRRGYAPMLICATCGYSPHCIHCDVGLTFHKSSQQLHCHYCGYRQASLNRCPACGGTHIEMKGFGTEKIEDELSRIIPEARIRRMDIDTTRKKNSYHQILSELEEGEIDILVGTQMVSKGLDFEKVSLIGIINADQMLNFPDFRAFERSYQLMSQVGGRAGRRSIQGKVIIQTYQPTHRIIKQVTENNYIGFYTQENEERTNFKYPPQCRLIRIDIKNKNPETLHQAAIQLSQALRLQLGERILGPEFPLVSRIRNYYIKSILIKLEKQGLNLQKVKEFIENKILDIETDKSLRGTIIQVDVDPM